MTGLNGLSVLSLCLSVLVFAEVAFSEKQASEGSDFFLRAELTPKGFSAKAADDRGDAKALFAEAVELQEEMKVEVEKLPSTLAFVDEHYERAQKFAIKAKASALRHSAATGKSSIAQNAFSIARRQKSEAESGLKTARDLMKVADRQMESAKKLFDENGKPVAEVAAKSAAFKVVTSLSTVARSVNKANQAASEIKKSADDAQRFAGAASVMASASVAKEYAGLANDYVSKGEDTVIEITTKKTAIDEFVAQLSAAKRQPLSAKIDAVKREFDTADMKLEEVKQAAKLASASKDKVEELTKKFNSEFEISDKLEDLATQAEEEAKVVIEHEKTGRAAYGKMLDASNAVQSAAVLLGVERDEAATPLILYGAFSLIVTLIASVLVF